MALIPAPIVAAPEPLRRRYGLFDAAIGPLDLPLHGEAGGIRYVPAVCGGQTYAYGVNCYTAETLPTKPVDSDNDLVEAPVFALLSTLACGPVGYTGTELEAKVRRRLEGSEQWGVEQALWSGLDFEGNPLGINTLSGTAVDVGVVTDPDGLGLITDVVATLEKYAYTEQGYGFTAYLHAPVEVAAFAAEAGLILADGQRKVTPMGSVWSFGAYPPGQIIVTGQTTVWRSPEVSVVQSLDRVTNEVLLLAERTYAVSFECFAGAVDFDPLEVVS